MALSYVTLKRLLVAVVVLWIVLFSTVESQGVLSSPLPNPHFNCTADLYDQLPYQVYYANPGDQLCIVCSSTVKSLQTMMEAFVSFVEADSNLPFCSVVSGCVVDTVRDELCFTEGIPESSFGDYICRHAIDLNSPCEVPFTITKGAYVAASPPSPVEVVGPFVTWAIPAMHDGEILRYEVRVTSATGSFVIVEKNKTNVYHLLEREDIPTDLGRMTSVAVQVRAVTTQGFGEWSTEKNIPVTVLVISDLIPYLLYPEPSIFFINNSPIVAGKDIEIHLATNYDTSSLECRLIAQGAVQLEDTFFHNCSSGHITYANLQTATYTFYAKATLQTSGQVLTLERKFRPDNGFECSVHLINNGLTISGSSAIIEYSFTGEYTRCKLDEGDFQDCSSPVMLTNLSPGAHFFKITSQPCNRYLRHPLKLSFNIP